MARTKQTACKSNPMSGLATHQGETESSSSEEPAMESTISETHGERESGEQIEQPRTARKRKRGDRTASSSLSSADHTRKSRKVAVEYSTDETDEEFEILKGKRAKNDVTPFLRLAKIFGSNTRTIQECNAGIKYRYTPQERGPQLEPPRRLQTTLVEEPATKSTTDTQGASDSSNDTEMA